MSLTPTLPYGQCSKCSDRTMESVYTTIRSAHPQCAAGMQSVSEIDAAITLAGDHFQHSLYKRKLAKCHSINQSIKAHL